ncbi:MAG: GTP cyclohydrolase II [Pseudomonadota bacterium]
MLTQRPTFQPSDHRFIAVHRLLGETIAARTIGLRDGARRALASPVDGGAILSDTLAISAARARHIGLGETPMLVRIPRAGPAQLSALATAEAPDLRGVLIEADSPIAAAATELAKLAERLPAMSIAEGNAPAGVLSADVGDVLGFRASLASTMSHVASAPVPLSAGATALFTAFRDAIGGTASAVMVGEAKPGALVRIHSSCITGDVFGSLKCDCGAQLSLALRRIAKDGGVLIYTSQEGRGIGLANKLRAYRLQDAGLDTVDANLALGYHDDERDYAVAARILAHLGLKDVRLLTNNPHKIEALAGSGLTVRAEPLLTPATEENARYLDTKRRRSGHML